MTNDPSQEVLEAMIVAHLEVRDAEDALEDAMSRGDADAENRAADKLLSADRALAGLLEAGR